MNDNRVINLPEYGFPTTQVILDDLSSQKYNRGICFIANQSAEDINDWLMLNRHESNIKGKKYMDTHVFAFREKDDLDKFVDIMNECNFKNTNLFDLMDLTDSLASVYGDVGFIEEVIEESKYELDLNSYCFIKSEGVKFCFMKRKVEVRRVECKITNIFDYATKELSQDAMIAFLISLCSSEVPSDQVVGRSFLDGLLNDTILSDKYIDKIGLPILQFCKVDVLTEVIVEGEKYLIVVEDKTNTNERDGQISGYISELESRYDIPQSRMIPIYYKTSLEYNVYNKESKIKVLDIYDIEVLMKQINKLSEKCESNYLINSYYMYIKKKVANYQSYLSEPDYECRFSHYYISQLVSYIYDTQKQYGDFNADITYNNGPSGVVLYKGLEEKLLSDIKSDKLNEYNIYLQLQFNALRHDELSKIKDVHLEFRFSKKNGEKISSDERWKVIENLKGNIDNNYKINGRSGGRTASLFTKSIYLQGVSGDEARKATTMVEHFLKEFIPNICFNNVNT